MVIKLIKNLTIIFETGGTGIYRIPLKYVSKERKFFPKASHIA